MSTNRRGWRRLRRYQVRDDAARKTTKIIAGSMNQALMAYAKGEGYRSWQHYLSEHQVLIGFDGVGKITISPMTAFLKK